ncbi:MAG: N-formylglutamate amidohydrolase [Rhodobacteraceae bacterium]|nr:N-formylglutamate amidohydrolase [Paracoccaceae bacterium]
MTYSPFQTFGADRSSRFLVICDHATNRVPPDLGATLGLPPEDMSRHIAYDVGAAGLAIGLAERLGAPAILTDFSRLVIDPNRGEDDPTLVMRLYDGSIIPRNRDVDAVEVTRRLDAYYRPYHDTVAQFAARRDDTAIISVHSFTPQFRGRALRPWHVGILFAEDDRLSAPLVDLLKAEPDLFVGENEPYSGALKGDTIDRHALQTGRQNTLIELRNDLIGSEAQQLHWADRLAPMLENALQVADI